MHYRLGIIGTGRIAERFVSDAWQRSGFTLTVVYNPHKNSGYDFVTRCLGNDTQVIGTDQWEELICNVDAVYIASPHETHFDYAKRLLESQKNVLCEKPMCLSKREVEMLYQLAAKNGVILLEAIKTAYCPGFQGIIDVIKAGEIGNVVDVEACFTKICPDGKRELVDVNYGGSVTELGTYVLLPVAKLLGFDYKNVYFFSKYASNGVDLFSKIILDYEDQFATCKVGLGVKSEGELIISGTKGYVIVEAPWWMTRKFEVRYEEVSKNKKYEFSYEDSGLCYEMKFFYEIIVDMVLGKKEFVKQVLDEGKKMSVFFADIIEKSLIKRNEKEDV